jgi:hypothetical protein
LVDLAVGLGFDGFSDGPGFSFADFEEADPEGAAAALAALALAAAACAAPLPFFGGIWKGGDVKRLVKEVTLLMRGMIAKVPRSRI